MRSNKFIYLVWVILETERILQFSDKKILDLRDTSFQRKKLMKSKREFRKLLQVFSKKRKKKSTEGAKIFTKNKDIPLLRL